MYTLTFQVKSGTIFDNFLITDDEKYAEKVGKDTWGNTKVRSNLSLQEGKSLVRLQLGSSVLKKILDEIFLACRN